MPIDTLLVCVGVLSRRVLDQVQGSQHCALKSGVQRRDEDLLVVLALDLTGDPESERARRYVRQPLDHCATLTRGGMQPQGAGGAMCRVRRQDQRRRAVARLSVLGLGVGAAYLTVSLAGIGSGDAQRWVEGAGGAGPVVFVLAGGVLGLALFPGQVTAAVAGILFGAVAGTALALAAALLAAALCFLAGRRLGADAVLSLLGPRGRLWRTWLEEHGFGAVLACRLAPGTPAGILNYLAGLAGIRLGTILAAVALGALPKTIAYVVLGGALSDPLSARGAFAVTLYAGAAACGAVVARRLVRSRPAGTTGTPVHVHA